MEDLVYKVSEKYGGSYFADPEKVVHTPHGSLYMNLSKASLVISDYNVIFKSHEDGATSVPYTIHVILKKSRKKEIYLFPRSKFGKIFRQIGYDTIRNKYTSNLNKQLLGKVAKDYKLENLLVVHNVSFLSKLIDNTPTLILSPIESVLNITCVDELIHIAVRVAMIIDENA